MGMVVRNHDGLGGGNCEGGVRMTMEWEKQQTQEQKIEQNGVVGVGLYVKVMTDEQMELLRRQISVYGTICEQLVEMHKVFTAQQDLHGLRLGNLYCDPVMASAANKIGVRQRWTPTPLQLQILERIFEQGNGTPSKQKIKEITTELSQHGHISESNVYNWFQNRRARSKRKQSVVPNSAESEVETDVESPKDKKTKPENMQSLANSAPRVESIYFPNPEISTEMHCLNTQPTKAETMFPSDHDLRSSGNLGELSFYENFPSNRRIDQLIGKMEVPGSFSPHRLEEGFDMVG